MMERLQKLVDKEIRKTFSDAPEKQERARKLAKTIFQWLDEGGLERIEEGLKGETLSIENAFEKQVEQVSNGLDES